MNRLFLAALPALIATIALLCISCGGGSGGSGANTVQPTLVVNWPARSRDVTAPSSALSIQVTIDGTTLQSALNRADNPAAHQEIYTIPTTVTPGTHTVTLSFNSLEDASGYEVATASASTLITSQSLSLGNFVFTGEIASVQVLQTAVDGLYVAVNCSNPPCGYTTTPINGVTQQIVPVGSTIQLVAAAFDQYGNDLVVSPGSIFWTSVNNPGAFTLTTDGHATGNTVGTGQVQVTVDGLPSTAQGISVTNPVGVVGCTNTTYQPNYATEIESSSDPTYSGDLMHWSSFPVTVQVVSNSYLTPNFQSLVATALQTWESATGNRVVYSTYNGVGVPDITITFQPSSTIDGSNDGTVGLTTAYPSSTNASLLASVGIQIASDLDNNTQTLNCICHELGHGLGIEGHSEVNQDLMNPYLNDDYAPTTDDVNTLLTAYCGSFPLATAAQNRSARPPKAKKPIIIR